MNLQCILVSILGYSVILGVSYLTYIRNKTLNGLEYFSKETFNPLFIMWCLCHRSSGLSQTEWTNMKSLKAKFRKTDVSNSLWAYDLTLALSFRDTDCSARSLWIETHPDSVTLWFILKEKSSTQLLFIQTHVMDYILWVISAVPSVSLILRWMNQSLALVACSSWSHLN